MLSVNPPVLAMAGAAAAPAPTLVALARPQLGHETAFSGNADPHELQNAAIRNLQPRNSQASI
jgi:hypothetical protein